MRKGAKFFVTASVFAVAMNANACMYGPPPEGLQYKHTTPTVGVEESYVIAEPVDWYFSAMGQYAVVRLLSVEETEQEDDNYTGEVLCGIEILSVYNPRLDLGLPTELIIPGEDGSSLSVGDILFVELGPAEWNGDSYTRCRIMEGENGAIFAPFVDNRLVLTEKLTKSFFYESLNLYNKNIQEYQLSLEKEEAYYMEFGTQPFVEGMTPEETEVFFQEFQKAKKDYEVVLNRINGVE